MPPIEQPASTKTRYTEILVVVVCLYAFLLTCLLAQWPEGQSKVSAKGIGIILAAGLTLIMYSFLYRDNPLFKAAENLYVGVTLGYTLITTYRLSLKPDIIDPLFIDPPTLGVFAGEFARRFVPIVLGLFLLTRLSRKYAWLSRYSYTLMVGWGAGIGIPIVVHTFILQQIQPAIRPLLDAETYRALAPFSWLTLSSPALWSIIGTLVILVGTVCVLFYFFFSVEHKGAGGAVSRVGIWFLMISFGASFGYTVMARVSLLIGRVQFLIEEWLGIAGR